MSSTNLAFTKLKLRLTWNLSYGVLKPKYASYSCKYWYLLLQICSYICVRVCVCFLLLFRNDRVLCLLKIFHIDVKFGKISSHLKLTLFVWDILLLNGLVYVTFNIRLVKCISLKLALPYVQSAWGFRTEMFRTAGLVACFNYLSKKKKKTYFLNLSFYLISIIG